jgi:hypothetical protein
MDKDRVKGSAQQAKGAVKEAAGKVMGARQPSLRCMCGGELRLKLIEPAVRNLGKQREIFVCTNCSREQTFLADQNPYVSTACGAQAMSR